MLQLYLPKNFLFPLLQFMIRGHEKPWKETYSFLESTLYSMAKEQQTVPVQFFGIILTLQLKIVHH